MPSALIDEQFARIVDELTRRGFLAGGLGSAALLGLAACGSSGGSPDSRNTASSAGYPVSVSGKFGPTTVTSPPKRIIALGQQPDGDAALALGVAPVALAKDPIAAGGIQPWTKAKLAGQSPTLLNTQDGPPLEQITALKPDLIIATTYYSLQQYHDQLSKIAPVLAYATGPNTDPWQDTVTRLGRLLNRSAQAESVIAAVEHTVAADRTAHPEFAGKSFTFGPVQADGTIYTTSSRSDLSAALLAQLGLTLSPKVVSLPASSTKGKSIVSPERLDVLDADVLILTYITAAQQTKLEANPLFQRLSAVRRGAYIALPLPVSVAMAFPSALSIPYALSKAVPLLAKVLG
jgi:iron complex transport system substrate-binding protein